MEASDFDSENVPRECSEPDFAQNESTGNLADLDEDEDEVQMSSKEVLESLQRAWINEKFAPDLLPFEDALVEMVMIQLVHMEENLASADKNNLLYIVHRMEVERISESTRPHNKKRLSDAEHKFAVDFHESVETHFYQLVVRHMPQNHQDDERVRRVGPNLDAHVFARARQDVGEFSLGGGEHSVNVRKGAVHLFKYRDIETLVTDGTLELI